MATRLYAHAVATQPKKPDISPAFDASWEKTTTNRVLLTPFTSGVAGGVSNPATTGTTGQGANPSDVAIVQAISEPLKAQTIQGNITGFFRANETNLTDNYNPAIIIRVIAPDGTVRGTVLSVLGGGTEFPTTSASIAFPAGQPVAATPVDAQEGDYLVIELGFTQTSAAVATGNIVLGYNRGNLDFTAEADTALKNGWIQFDTDITFQTDRVLLSPILVPLAPGQPVSQFSPQVYSSAPAGIAQTLLNLGIALETDAAQAFTGLKQRTLGITSETDTALALTRLKQRALGVVSEADTALPFVRQKLRSLGIISETDLAQALTRTKTRVLGIASETDLGQAFTRSKTRALGAVSEADTAQALSRLKQRVLGIATETDLALALPHAGAAVVRKLKMLMGMGQ